MYATENGMMMPTNYVDMGADELTYEGAGKLSSIFKSATIISAIALGGSLVLGAGSLVGVAFTSGMVQTAMSGIFYGMVGTSIAATGMTVLSSLCWGSAAMVDHANPDID